MSRTLLPPRVAAVAAVLFAVCFFLTVASVNVPHQAGDAELLAWWRQDANVTSGMVSMLFAFLTAVLFSVVANHLLVLVGPGSPHLTAFARSMATSFTVTLLVSAALRGVIGHLVRVEDGALPGIDTLRFATALNYTVLGVVVMGCFGLFAVAVSAMVLLQDLGLSSWLGYVGAACGLFTLGAVGAMMGAFTVPLAILWALTTAVAVWRRPAVPETRVEPRPEVVVV